MGYEVDFLPVGEGERSGDAIALRFGNLSGSRDEQVVIVIDGGFQDTGEQLVEHINRYYNTNIVDVAFSTHSDADHASGLLVVLERMTVYQLAMHQPWNHGANIAGMFRDGRVTATGISEKLRKSLEAARALERAAQERRIQIVEPFAGASGFGGRVRVLGPTRAYYEELLPGFRGMPEAKAQGLFAKAYTGLAETVTKVAERWNIETLTDKSETSPENNSSVILLMESDGHHLLFTGDAGIPALMQTADRLHMLGVDLSLLRLVQVPHHGSHHNIGPTVLDRLIGERLREPAVLRTAIVSAAKDDPDHPSKKVANAFRRRGAPVYATNGATLCFSHQAPSRGWAPATALPFYDEVEE